jgi:Flp pilus assembly pilin Flp
MKCLEIKVRMEGDFQMSDFMNRVYVRLTAAALSLKDREEGQGMVEYALVLVLVAVAAAAAFTGLKDKIGTALTTIGNAL